MSEFRVRSTGQILNELEMRVYVENHFNGRMLPAVLTKAVLDEVEIDPVLQTPEPVVDFQTSARDGAEQDSLGNWVQKWKLTPWPQGMIDTFRASSARDAWQQIQRMREARKNGGFPCGEHWFHSDTASKIQHIANKDTARDQLAAGGLMTDPLLDEKTGEQIIWKTMSQTWVPLTCQLVFDIARECKAQEFATHRAAEQHKALMLQSVNPARYNYRDGLWPQIYDEFVKSST